ncbi:MAG: hypothetical protein KAW12_26900 [Candidatus Aminicenantes bacterium]|nr:hypothetical protein [Candidatus Aminicenantes bacterium]
MTKNAEEIKLVKDWLRFAEENLLLAHSGMGEEFSPYHTVGLAVKIVRSN